MSKPWNQRQVQKQRGVLIASGLFLLLLISTSSGAAAISQGGGPGTAVEQVRQVAWKQVDQIVLII